jgi:hypothetical protein
MDIRSLARPRASPRDHLFQYANRVSQFGKDARVANCPPNLVYVEGHIQLLFVKRIQTATPGVGRMAAPVGPKIAYRDIKLDR